MLYRSPDGIKDSYDVVVIGGGLGGLTGAQVLAKKFGRRVLLLEQHFKLGGLATWFNRKGHIFDVSLHGFPVGMKKTCKRYWTKEIADSIVQLSGIRFENPQFSFTTTFDKTDFTNKLINYFNLDPAVVDRFFKTLRAMDYFQGEEKTVGELLEEFFPGRNDVVRLLMEPITYANGSTLDEPALTYGIVFSNFMSKGVYTFQGGTDLLIEKMQEELLRSGVDIGISCLAEKIVVEDKTVKAVVAGGREIPCRSVISNGNLLTTINKLVGPEHFRDEFVTETGGIRLNNSSCQVYMGVREGESIPDVGDLIFTSEEPTFIPEKLRAMDTKSRTFSIYYPKTRPGTNRYSVVASTNANYDDWAAFTDDEYAAAKEQLCKTSLECLEKFIPGVREKIDYVEAATPKTFKRYTLHEKGASFGTKFEGLTASMNLQKEINGLYHTGSVGIIMSGWLGAANYGVITANGVDGYLMS
ncbi:MAG: NAD(P)-binding protein [bacterium]|jgi:phytoene dehydrogenase-like protein|nr:NAD(P)-binding protein [bacterium]